METAQDILNSSSDYEISSLNASESLSDVLALQKQRGFKQ